MDLWLSHHDARVRAITELQCGAGSSPFGDCITLCTGSHLMELRFTDQSEECEKELSTARHPIPVHRTAEADRLLALAFQNPIEVPVMAIGTPFQLTIWERLRRSPTATTITYGELARGVGRPKAARAVGRAVGANKIAVLIPCHRVVSQGKIGGYRWGVDRKRELLSWELMRRDPLTLPF